MIHSNLQECAASANILDDLLKISVLFLVFGSLLSRKLILLDLYHKGKIVPASRLLLLITSRNGLRSSC